MTKCNLALPRHMRQAGNKARLRTIALLNPVLQTVRTHQNQERTPATEDGRKEKEPGRKKKIKWPKANKSEVWKKLDSDLTLMLQNSLQGKVENEVSILSEIIYEVSLSRFG